MMDFRQFFHDKNALAGPMAKAHAALRAFLLGILASLQSSRKAPDDFATRPEIPSPEDYEAASTAQILDRLYRNPCGLLNEQPYLDTLMNARTAENNRKQTRHLIFGFYILAFSATVLAFRTPPVATPPPQTAEQQQKAEKALENAMDLLKEEFNLKLQSKELEIKDLKRQISLFNQGQAELTKRVKSLSKNASPTVKPPVADKIKKPK
jgi:hypothetical protein